MQLSNIDIVAITLWITGLLCLLNIVLVLVFRHRGKSEIAAYYTSCGIELVIFVFFLLYYAHVITRADIPVYLPPKLPFNLAQIGATLAIGMGLFPIAYWHHVNLSDLPGRIARDGQEMKEQHAGVRVRDSSHGEWLN